MAMAEKSIEGKVVKVLQETESMGGTNQMRIVRWIVNGKDTGALLEKRNFYIPKDGGDPKMGKAKGMNKEELRFIVEHFAEIEKLMS